MVTIKHYQHGVIEGITHAVDTAVDAINVLMYFVVVTLLFQLLAKGALPCK